ncbi:hypothetical protein [Nocardiopsis sp. CNR-923]|uniref:hypothetical protein n=1 Tax=Nocardiopsis sp. CNR-923 TaxID=1904965 RepID=UPI0013016261|nr:hypothetical protein [Nocardiopsis sp. CNR-923]
MSDHHEDQPDSVKIPSRPSLADAVGLALILPPRPPDDGDPVARLQAVLRAALDS